MCVYGMCVYDMSVMYYDTHTHITHTLMDVCVHLSSQRLGFWSFSPLSFWGLSLVAAYAWLTGPQASGHCPVSDTPSRNTETAQSTFCFTQVLGVRMKILRLSKHITH